MGEAVANNAADLETLARRGGPQETFVLASLETIWTSPLLPEDPIIWRKGLDAGLKMKLRMTLLAHGQGAGPSAAHEREVLTNLNFGAFKPATDDHLLQVREIESVDRRINARKSGDQAAVQALETEIRTLRARLAALAAGS